MIAIQFVFEERFYQTITSLTALLELQMVELTEAVTHLTDAVKKISDNVAAETNTITNLASKVDDGVTQLKALVAQLRASSVGANLDPVAIEQLAQQVSAQADQISQDNAAIQAKAD